MRQQSSPFSPFLLFLSLATTASLCLGYLATNTPLRIDCGATEPVVSDNLQWQPDKYFLQGSEQAINSSEVPGLSPAEYTLRSFFSENQGCYKIPRPNGRYLVRLGFAYYNYDQLLAPPVFDIYVQNTLIETVDIQAVEAHYFPERYYTDYMVYVHDGFMQVCLKPVVGVPFINTIELTPADTDAYEGSRLGHNVILSTYLRVNFGGPALGPEPEDPGFRHWTADASAKAGNYTLVGTNHSIGGAGNAPDFLPAKMFQTAREAKSPQNFTSFRMNLVPIDPMNEWYLRLYFAEIGESVKVGDRMLDVNLGTDTTFHPLALDVLHNTTKYNAFVVQIVFNYTQYVSVFGEQIEIGVYGVPGSALPPIVSGAELFEVVVVQGQDKYGLYKDGLAIGEIVLAAVGTLVGFGVLGFICYMLFVCCSRGRGSGESRGFSGTGPFGGNEYSPYNRSKAGEFPDELGDEHDVELSQH